MARDAVVNTLQHGASEKASLRWAEASLDAQWHPLLRQVQADRDRPWDPTERPRPGSVDKTLAFAAYAVDVAASLAPNR
jgi:hypothetical protein